MVDTTLGPCHYSEDMSEQATLMAVREDGPGWIPICEDHKSDAESDGYKVQEVTDLEDALEQNKDMPEPSKEGKPGEASAGSDGEDSTSTAEDQGEESTGDEGSTDGADDEDEGDDDDEESKDDEGKESDASDSDADSDEAESDDED